MLNPSDYYNGLCGIVKKNTHINVSYHVTYTHEYKAYQQQLQKVFEHIFILGYPLKINALDILASNFDQAFQISILVKT